MEETKEDEAKDSTAEDSAVAPAGGRKKKSSWPHSVINAKAAKVEAEKPTPAPAPKSKAERKTQPPCPKSKTLIQNDPGKIIEKETNQPDDERGTVAINDQGGADLADWKEGCTFKCKMCAFTATLR